MKSVSVMKRGGKTRKYQQGTSALSLRNGGCIRCLGSSGKKTLDTIEWRVFVNPQHSLFTALSCALSHHASKKAPVAFVWLYQSLRGMHPLSNQSYLFHPHKEGWQFQLCNITVSFIFMLRVFNESLDKGTWRKFCLRYVEKWSYLIKRNRLPLYI